MKKYRVTYNVFYMSVADNLDLLICKPESKITVTFDVIAPNKLAARQIASDEASTFLNSDFVIRGKTMNSFKPLSIEEIR
jgi:hypothetical protein